MDGFQIGSSKLPGVYFQVGTPWKFPGKPLDIHHFFQERKQPLGGSDFKTFYIDRWTSLII